MSNFPSINKFFNVFDSETSYLQQAKSFEEPKLARKMEDYQGGGMDSPVQMDVGGEKLEATINYVGKHAAKDYGSQTLDGVYRRVTASYQDDATGAVDAVEHVMRGRISEIDAGNLERGKVNEEKEKLSLVYYRKSLNGQVMIEIDTLNMIFRVRKGNTLVDLYAAHRAALA